jgi:hypothetical protein
VPRASPTRSDEGQDGASILQRDQREDGQSVHSDRQWRRRVAGYCRATFRLENGRVAGVSYAGDNDPLEGPNSACGGLMRACLFGEVRPSLAGLLQLGRAQVDDRKAEEGKRQGLMGQSEFDRDNSKQRRNAERDL